MKFSAKEIILATNAEVLKNETQDCDLFEISTDTRTVKNGDIYLPLKGEKFDGEKFIDKAVESGADAYFTTCEKVEKNAKLVLKVKDTKIAYLEIASFAREKFNPKVLMITGSSGKTTTKEMMFSVLNEKFKTHKTALNHNNEIGFCQTVLSMPEKTEALIIETGMRGLGEIELVAKYAKPDIGIVANVGTAHIGRLGSREKIAEAKCEIVDFIKENGTFIAHDDDLIKNKSKRFCGEKIYFSLDNVKIEERKIGYTKFKYKNFEFELNVEGDYNVQNSLASIESGLKLGMNFEEIEKGLKKYVSIEKRWESEEIGGYNIINDSYNANPESMKASVGTFLELYSKEKLLTILGDMGELGDKEVQYHEEVGEFLAEKMSKMSNVKMFTVGNLAENIAKKTKEKGIFTKSFKKNEQVAQYLLENVEFGTTIFLKASHSMRFEEIIEAIRKGK